MIQVKVPIFFRNLIFLNALRLSIKKEDFAERKNFEAEREKNVELLRRINDVENKNKKNDKLITLKIGAENFVLIMK